MLDVFQDLGDRISLLVDLVDQNGELYLPLEEFAQLSDLRGAQSTVLHVHHQNEIAAQRQIALDRRIVRAQTGIEARHVDQHFPVAPLLGVPSRCADRSLRVLRRQVSGRQGLLLDALELRQIDSPQQSIILAVQLDPFRRRRVREVNLGRQCGLWHDVSRQTCSLRSFEPSIHQRGLAGVEGAHDRYQNSKIGNLGTIVRCPFDEPAVSFDLFRDFSETIERVQERVFDSHVRHFPSFGGPMRHRGHTLP